MRWLVLVLALVVMSSPVRAEWYEASSEHFVVYADGDERSTREFTTQLEKFHQTVMLVTGLQSEVPSPSNRVTVFVVRGEQAVRRLYGDRGSQVAGFYIPRAGGSVAYVPRVRNADDFSMIVLLHEYTHHLMISASSFPVPRWMNEGSAEFFASAEFPRDGSVKVGMPAQHRAYELVQGRDVPVEQLVDPELYATRRVSRYDAFYGKSWLLYHYLTFEPSRRGQLVQYLNDLAAGLSSREAADKDFGDLDALEDELESYMKRRTLQALVIDAAALHDPQIALRELSEGEIAMLPVRLQSRRGVTREQAIELLDDAREVAADYPDNAAVLAALAEAEFDAGNDAEAVAAADAALARDPTQVNAYVQKGYALFREAQLADDKEAAFNSAVQPFLALNRLENDHPLPLIYYFRSFSDRGAQPSDLAIQGLERAAELAPFDLGLRFNLARTEALVGQTEDAVRNLLPIAYNPHGGVESAYAKDIAQRLERDPPSDPAAVAAIFDEAIATAIAAAGAGDEGGED